MPLNDSSETARVPKKKPEPPRIKISGHWPLSFSVSEPRLSSDLQRVIPCCRVSRGEERSDHFSNKQTCPQSALVCELPQNTEEHTLARQEAEQSQEAEQTEQEWGHSPLIFRCEAGCLNPLSTYLWPFGGAWVGRHPGQAGVRRPSRSRAAGPFFSNLYPILSAFPACSLQCVVQEGSNRGLC